MALIQAIPALKSLVDQFVTLYVSQVIQGMRAENIQAIRDALDKHDQRGLENAIGSPLAGKPSGDAGSVIVDAPPPNVLR